MRILRCTVVQGEALALEHDGIFRDERRADERRAGDYWEALKTADGRHHRLRAH